MNINDYVSKNRIKNNQALGLGRTPLVRCKSGLEMSVQASDFHWCSPRNMIGPYLSMEIGFPNRIVEELMPYAEDYENPLDTVYPYVPVGLIDSIIEKNSGFADDSSDNA